MFILMEIYIKYFSFLNTIPTNYTKLKSHTNCFFDICKKKYEVSIIKNKETFTSKYDILGFINKVNNNNLTKTLCVTIKEYDNDGLFGTTICASSKIIGFIHLLNDNTNKILYIYDYLINNELFAFDNSNIFDEPLNKSDEDQVKKILFELVENIAKDNNCNNIYLDIHPELIYYKDNNLEELGFILTEEKSKNKLNWHVAKKILNVKSNKIINR